MTAFVTAGNLGGDFDVGGQVAGKLNVVKATNAAYGKMRFATSAEATARTSGVVMDAAQVGAAFMDLTTAQAIVGPKTLAPPANTLGTGLVVTQTGQGTPGKDFPFNSISLTETASGGTTIYGVTALAITHNYGGANVSGARNTLVVQATFTAASSATSDNRDYVAAYVRQIVQAPDNGTSSAPKGAFFGINPVCEVRAGATNLLDATGDETDIGMYSGASSIYRVAKRLASYGSAKATSIDAAQMISCLDSNPGFGSGYVVSAVGGGLSPPSPVTGGLFYGAADSGAKITSSFGLDFNAFSFINYTFAFPGGVILSPAGALTLPSASIGTVTGAEATYQGYTVAAPSTPTLLFNATSNPTDSKIWQFYVETNGSLALVSLNDASNSAALAIEFIRVASSAAIRAISFGAPIVTTGVTVANLPTTGVPVGARLHVTDASSMPVWGAGPVGGGSLSRPVFFAGTGGTNGWVYG